MKAQNMCLELAERLAARNDHGISVHKNKLDGSVQVWQSDGKRSISRLDFTPDDNGAWVHSTSGLWVARTRGLFTQDMLHVKINLGDRKEYSCIHDAYRDVHAATEHMAGLVDLTRRGMGIVDDHLDQHLEDDIRTIAGSRLGGYGISHVMVRENFIEMESRHRKHGIVRCFCDQIGGEIKMRHYDVFCGKGDFIADVVFNISGEMMLCGFRMPQAKFDQMDELMVMARLRRL